MRRDALARIGGFARGTIAEDLPALVALRSLRLKTLYLNQRLSAGLAPESVPEYVKQRIRWCLGTYQQLFIRTGPIFGRYSLIDRAFYIEPVVYWATFPFVVALLVAPIVYWFTGVSALPCRPGGDLLTMLVAKSISRWLVMGWLTQWKVIPLVTVVSKAIPAFHLVAAQLLALFNPFGAGFAVTAKGLSRDRVIVQWEFFSIFAALDALLITGMALNILHICPFVTMGEQSSLDALWGVYAALVLTVAALACIELPARGESPDFEGGVQHARPRAAAKAILRRLFG